MLTVFNRNTNEGKTYTKKEEADAVYARKAEQFNVWFNENYSWLVGYFKSRNRYDGSLISETYLKVYENILYRGGYVENYKGLFLTAYFRNLHNTRVYDNRFLELDTYHEKEENETVYDTEAYRVNTEVEMKLFDYVYSRYTIQEYEIFKMYINLQPAISYGSLSRIVGIDYWKLFRIVSSIRKDLKTNYEKIITGEIYRMDNGKPIKQLNQSYVFSTDYDALWNLRMKTNYSVICVVDDNGSKCVANMIPCGEIFAGDTCYSDFEGVSKSEFIKQCERLKVEYIKPNYPEAVQGELF